MLKLESSYQLLGVVRDDGIRTYRALEIASGQGLQVHLFVRPEDQELFRSLRALPATQRRDLLEFGQEDDAPYVVTEKLPDGIAARSWFQAKSAKSAAGVNPVLLAGVWKTGTPLPDDLKPPAPEAKKPAPAPLPDYADATRVFRVSDLPKAHVPESFEAPETGEFERMFAGEPAQKPPEQPKPEPPIPMPPPPVPEQPLPQPVASGEEDEEFARMFGTQAKTPAPQVSEQSGPGEFTRMFQAQAKTPAQQPDPEKTRLFQAPEPKPEPKPDPKREPSEFTRFFNSPLAPSQEKQQPFGTRASAPPQTPPQPPQNRAGEFTQMFGNPKAPQGPPPPPLGSAGTATGAFATPGRATPPPLKSAHPAPPSEFTQMMSAGSAAMPTLGQKPAGQNAPPLPPPSVGAKKSNAPLFIALGAVLLAVVLVVAMFLLKKS